MTGTVTVVMPNWNHGRYVAEALRALAGQSAVPERILFFDDGSTDESLDVVRGLQVEMPFLEIHANAERRGVVANCNAGLDLTATDYVYFAAADDRVLDGFLATAIRLLDAHSEVPLCAQGSFSMTADGAISRGEMTCLGDLPEGVLPPARVHDRFRTHSVFMAGNGTVYRTSALRELGGLPDLGPYSDSVAIFVLGLRFGACVSPTPRAAWRRLESGFSASIKGDPERSLALISDATVWVTNQLAPTPYGGFPEMWQARALYQVACPLIMRGNAPGLKTLLPGEPFWGGLVRLGPAGRRVARALLLLRLAPQAFIHAFREKIGMAWRA